jgi:hypothetical protein
MGTVEDRGAPVHGGASPFSSRRCRISSGHGCLTLGSTATAKQHDRDWSCRGGSPPRGAPTDWGPRRSARRGGAPAWHTLLEERYVPVLATVEGAIVLPGGGVPTTGTQARSPRRAGVIAVASTRWTSSTPRWAVSPARRCGPSPLRPLRRGARGPTPAGRDRREQGRLSSGSASRGTCTSGRPCANSRALESILARAVLDGAGSRAPPSRCSSNVDALRNRRSRAQERSGRRGWRGPASSKPTSLVGRRGHARRRRGKGGGAHPGPAAAGVGALVGVGVSGGITVEVALAHRGSAAAHSIAGSGTASLSPLEPRLARRRHSGPRRVGLLCGRLPQRRGGRARAGLRCPPPR